jgi:hypothetical protein
MTDPSTSTECSGEHCNQDPIKVCTSLTGALSPSTFEHDCRELAEMMCHAVVRAMEEHYRKHKSDPTPALPQKLRDWKAWAKGLTGGQGLPDCLDLSDPTNRTLGESMKVDVAAQTTTPTQSAAKYTNRAYQSVLHFGTSLASFDLDDWHDD